MRSSLLVLSIGSLLLSCALLRAQRSAGPGCTVSKGYYQCNQAAFAALLKAAETVEVESKPFDQATTNSLSRLVKKLGKQEVLNAADLKFVLIRTDAEGISYGPSDRELASFLVYARDHNGGERQLVWIETFDGEPDLAWPIVVFDILRQFKANFH